MPACVVGVGASVVGVVGGAGGVVAATVVTGAWLAAVVVALLASLPHAAAATTRGRASSGRARRVIRFMIISSTHGRGPSSSARCVADPLGPTERVSSWSAHGGHRASREDSHETWLRALSDPFGLDDGCRSGPSEEVALAAIAAHRPEPGELQRRLQPLG